MDIIHCQRDHMTNAERELLCHLTMSKIDHSDCFDYELDYRTDSIFIFCSGKIKQAFDLARQSNSFQFVNFIITFFKLNTDSNSETARD